jgi:hypothetical protein
MDCTLISHHSEQLSVVRRSNRRRRRRVSRWKRVIPRSVVDTTINGSKATNARRRRTSRHDVTDNHAAPIVAKLSPCTFITRGKTAINVGWEISGRVTRRWTWAGALLGCESGDSGKGNIHVKRLIVIVSV